MSKYLTLAALAFAVALPASSQLLVDEFSYTPGTNLTSNGWTQYRAGTSIAVVVGSLSHPDYGSSGIGNSVGVIQDVSAERVKRSFAPQTTGTVYVSFLIHPTAVTPNVGSGRIVQLGPAGMTGTEPGVRILLHNDGTGFEVAADKTGGFLPFTSGNFTLATTHLIIVKYEFLSGTSFDDTVSLFVDPVLGGLEPAPDVFNQGGQSDATDLSEVGITAFDVAGTDLTIDGLRISTTWDDAMPVELISFEVQ